MNLSKVCLSKKSVLNSSHVFILRTRVFPHYPFLRTRVFPHYPFLGTRVFPHYPLRGGETGLNRGRFRPATGESGLMTFGLRSSTTYSITSFEVEAAATELGGGRGHLEGKE